MKYIIFIIIFFYPLNIYASSKDLIKNKLELTNNISFKFETGTKNDDDVMRMGIGYMF